VAVALLVAAGSGERLGSDRPKAFVVLAGRPMLEWSVAALRAAGIDKIVVAVPAGEAAPEGCVGVEGGLTRLDERTKVVDLGAFQVEVRPPLGHEPVVPGDDVIACVGIRGRHLATIGPVTHLPRRLPTHST